MFLRGMWHAMHAPPAPAGSWCACARSASARGVACVAAGAHVRCRRASASALELFAADPRRADRGRWCTPSARAQPPSRKSRASPELIELPPGVARSPRRAALPCPRVAREEHLVAARAGAVDRLGARRLARARRWARRAGTRYAARSRAARGRSDVLAAAAVARLAADADLDEVRRRRIAPHGMHARAQQCAPRLEPRRGAARWLVTQHGELARERARQRLLVGDLERAAPRRRQQAIHDLALVAGRARAVELAPGAVEVGVGVVAEDAGLIPDAARAQAGALAHHHRITFETKRRRLEHERDGQDELGLGAMARPARALPSSGTSTPAKSSR